MLCAILTVHDVNFEEIGPISEIPKFRKGKPSENRGNFRKIFPDFQNWNSEKFVHFRCFSEHALRSRVHTGKLNRYKRKISGKVVPENPENPEFRKTVFSRFFLVFFDVKIQPISAKNFMEIFQNWLFLTEISETFRVPKFRKKVRKWPFSRNSTHLRSEFWAHFKELKSSKKKIKFRHFKKWVSENTEIPKNRHFSTLT
jgi:hypothetical protein